MVRRGILDPHGNIREIRGSLWLDASIGARRNAGFLV